MIKSLSPKAESLIEGYLNIKVGPFKTTAPYYMNILSKRLAPAVWVGKGLPSEIEVEADKIYRRYRPYFEYSISQGYNLLLNAGLGIDCSGSVCRVLDRHLMETSGKRLYQVVKPSNIFSRLLVRLRPFTSISADYLTNDLNSVSIKDLEVRPGDLIRFSRYHVALVEKVEYKGSKPVEITYIESGIRPTYGVQRTKTRDLGTKLRRLKACL